MFAGHLSMACGSSHQVSCELSGGGALCVASAGGARGSGAWRSSEQGSEPGCLGDPAHQQEEDPADVSLLEKEATLRAACQTHASVASVWTSKSLKHGTPSPFSHLPLLNEQL